MPYVSLRSLNFPDRFIRHQHFLGELTPILSDQDRQDATFWLPDGVRVNDQVRVRAAHFTAHVLRHQDFRIKLHEFNPPLAPPNPRPETAEERLLREDVTFVVLPGLADPNALSFRSLNFPDRFIRHRGFHLFLEPVAGDVARQDATFRLEAPFAPPPPVVLH